MSRAPEFRRVWAAAQTQARERAVRRRKRGVASGLAGAVLVLVLLPGRHAPEPDLETLAALSQRLEAQPLDFLLETPGVARLESTPAFGDPLREERWSVGTESEERTET